MRMTYKRGASQKHAVSAGLASIVMVVGATVAVAQTKQENLLSPATATFLAGKSIGIDASTELKLRDGNTGTLAKVRTRKKAPTELLYVFRGKTVTPRMLKLKVGGPLTHPAKIEVLVSTLSPTTGFKSVRTDPIKSSENWHYYRFEQSAAKWVLLKITPFHKEATVALAEIELHGHIGAPEAVYAFNESPADAIAVLSKLSASIATTVSDDEKSLFADASDGKLETWSFAEASLLSSGITEKQDRANYLKKIDRLELSARAAVPSSGDAFQRGKALLTWLHSDIFAGGYKEQQTRLSSVLDNKIYNCVSSATLYNIIARRLALEVRGIEVPTHAFSILYDGTQHADIETTTPQGFNPARNKSGASAFEKQTGFSYIPDIYRHKRREIGAPGMIALTYYNRGVAYSEIKDYPKALVSYFKALSLDPESKSSVKNILSTLGNWSLALSKSGQLDKALDVLSTGLELAPKHRTLRHNHKALLQQKIRTTLKSRGEQVALALVKRAYEETGDRDYAKMQAWIFTQQGEARIKEGDWDGALKLVDVALASVDDDAKRDIQKWRPNVLLRWANAALAQKDFAQAADILERGLGGESRDYQIENSLGYVAQEWSAHVEKTKGEAAGHQLVSKLAKRFPQLTSVGNAIGRFAYLAAKRATDAGNYEAAIEIYQNAMLDRPKDYKLKQNHRATWVQWARKPMADRDWETALKIYEKGLAADPAAHIFKQNIAYIVQEWSRSVARTDGVVAGEELVTKLALRLPKVSSINRARGQIFSQETSKLVKARKFKEAALRLKTAEKYFSSSSSFRNSVLNVYYNWAEPLLKEKNWANAIKILSEGHKAHPKNYKLKQNLVAAWHQWAKVHLDKKEWQNAIDVYENGLKALPGTSLFRQNIRYCKAQLSK